MLAQSKSALETPKIAIVVTSGCDQRIHRQARDDSPARARTGLSFVVATHAASGA
jgi:hypothetical protein